jgi:hypothetical protein
VAASAKRHRQREQPLKKGNNRPAKETAARQYKKHALQERKTRTLPSLLAEKKLADFGTSNNIATSAFNSLINRTKMFLVSYCNLSNN